MKDINKILDRWFDDSCNIIDIYYNDISSYAPFYILKNTSKDYGLKVREMPSDIDILIPANGVIDIFSLPYFRKRKISDVKDFVNNCKEIENLKKAGLIEIRENLFTKSPLYSNKFSAKIFVHGQDISEAKGYENLCPESLALAVINGYFFANNDLRSLCCLRFNVGKKKYFFERFPSEIEEYRKKGIDGRSTMRYDFLKEFQNAYSSLSLDT